MTGNYILVTETFCSYDGKGQTLRLPLMHGATTSELWKKKIELFWKNPRKIEILLWI